MRFYASRTTPNVQLFFDRTKTGSPNELVHELTPQEARWGP